MKTRVTKTAAKELHMPEIDAVKAREVLNVEKAFRTQSCIKEVEEVLTRYNCEIQVAMLVTPTGNFPQANIVAKD